MTCSNPNPGRSIVYLLDTFPSDSETFIANELVRMAKLLPVEVIALGRSRSIAHTEGPPPVTYIPGVLSLKLIWANIKLLINSPAAYFRSLLNAVYSTDRLRQVKALYRSAFVANYVKQHKIHHIHAHFASYPSDIARIAARIANITFSFSAHAHDIYTYNPSLPEKIRDSLFVVTCTKYNQKYLQSIVSRPEESSKIHAVYHGIVLDSWPFSLRSHSAGKTIRILSVGRFVEKKGYGYLLEAVRILREWGFEIEWHAVGNGLLAADLKKKAKEYGLVNAIHFTGWKSHRDIRELFTICDLLVQPSVIADDGDRDGIPNIIPEAMASGIPIMATAVSGIPEILNDNNSVIIPEKNPEAIANAIKDILSNKACRQELIYNARKTVQKFDINDNIKKQHKVFAKYLTNQTPV